MQALESAAAPWADAKEKQDKTKQIPTSLSAPWAQLRNTLWILGLFCHMVTKTVAGCNYFRTLTAPASFFTIILPIPLISQQKIRLVKILC